MKKISRFVTSTNEYGGAKMVQVMGGIYIKYDDHEMRLQKILSGLRYKYGTDRMIHLVEDMLE